MTRLSIPPVDSKSPVGDHSAIITQDLCPVRVLIGVSVRVSQILTVLSPEAEAILSELKLNLALRMASECPSNEDEILVMGLT